MPGAAAWLLSMAILAALLAGCQTTRPAGPPLAPTPVVPPAGKTVWAGDYATHVQPIFDQYCVGCHGPSKAENGLRLDSYQGVMKGTISGPVVIPGQPANSTLVSVMRGTVDPSIRMPHGGQRLSEPVVQNVVLWVEAGAPPPKQ